MHAWVPLNCFRPLLRYFSCSASEMGDLLENLMDDIHLTQKLFQEDRVTEAYFLLQNIERFIQELHPELQAVVEKVLTESEQIENLRKEGLRNANLLSLFEDAEAWNDWTAGVGTNQDVVVGIHKNEEQGQYYLKIEGRIQCELLHVLAALLENELYKFWMPLCTSSRTVAVLSAYRRIVHTKVDLALIQKETVFVGHGDILPDGGILVTLTPSTPEEDHKHVPAATLTGIPEPDARMNISGGFLIYEELEDEVGDIENMAAEEYEAHNERLNARSTGAGQKAKVLRRKSFTTYTKHFGGADQSSSKKLDLHAVANLSLANDKEYNDRMLTLGRKAGKSKHMTEKQSQAALTLDRYKLSVQELYEVKTQPAASSGATGLADTVNPLFGSRSVSSSNNPNTSNMKSSFKKNASNHSMDDRSSSRSLAFVNDKKVVLVKGIFHVDPRLNFMPDWIFNMAVRSASAMMIPMLEFQAKQFEEDGLHRARLDSGRALYAEIERRLNELKDAAAVRAEEKLTSAENAALLGAQFTQAR